MPDRNPRGTGQISFRIMKDEILSRSEIFQGEN